MSLCGDRFFACTFSSPRASRLAQQTSAESCSTPATVTELEQCTLHSRTGGGSFSVWAPRLQQELRSLVQIRVKYLSGTNRVPEGLTLCTNILEWLKIPLEICVCAQAERDGHSSQVQDFSCILWCSWPQWRQTTLISQSGCSCNGQCIFN